MALPRAYRLSLRLHRDRLTKTGKTHFGRYFTIVTAQSDEEINNPRFAVLVSKKNAALAVDRNTIKRRVLSLIQTNLPLPQLDYLVIPKHQVLSATTEELQKDFVVTLQH